VAVQEGVLQLGSTKKVIITLLILCPILWANCNAKILLSSMDG
jgi:hypothetical protein